MFTSERKGATERRYVCLLNTLRLFVRCHYMRNVYVSTFRRFDGPRSGRRPRWTGRTSLPPRLTGLATPSAERTKRQPTSTLSVQVRWRTLLLNLRPSFLFCSRAPSCDTLRPHKETPPSILVEVLLRGVGKWLGRLVLVPFRGSSGSTSSTVSGASTVRYGHIVFVEGSD